MKKYNCSKYFNKEINFCLIYIVVGPIVTPPPLSVEFHGKVRTSQVIPGKSRKNPGVFQKNPEIN